MMKVIIYKPCFGRVPYLLSRDLLDDHSISNDTLNRADTTYLDIFFSLKSGSFWVRGMIYLVCATIINNYLLTYLLTYLFPFSNKHLHTYLGKFTQPCIDTNNVIVFINHVITI